MEIPQTFQNFCNILPPVFTNIADVLVNLPIILLFLITLPVRFFVCILSVITKISPTCALLNIFPFLSIICPLVTASTSAYSCYGNCKYCQSGTCVEYPQSLINLCTQCQNQYSILNKIFCDIGVVLFSLLIPFTTLINIVLIPATGKQLCISVNPNACG